MNLGILPPFFPRNIICRCAFQRNGLKPVNHLISITGLLTEMKEGHLKAIYPLLYVTSGFKAVWQHGTRPEYIKSFVSF